MKKKLWLIVLAVLIVVLGVYAFSGNSKKANAFDPANATYAIGDQRVALIDGKAEMASAPGSASKTVTMLFGQPVSGDLNGDGKTDAAVLLTQTTGGSGTFYYAAAALAGTDGADGTNAILLGDRIAPQTIAIKNGQIVVNYADRKPGEPLTAKPSVGVSKYMTFDGSTLKIANAIASGGEPCGGNMTTAPTCVTGFHCAPRPGTGPIFGDVGGICVAN